MTEIIFFLILLSNAHKPFVTLIQPFNKKEPYGVSTTIMIRILFQVSFILLDKRRKKKEISKLHLTGQAIWYIRI